jgi:hypothetical protein
MGRFVTSFLLVGCVTFHAAAFQARSGAPASGAPQVTACSLLTPDIVQKYIDARAIKLLTHDDSPVGTKGTSCEYGRIGLRLNPLGQNAARQPLGKDWQPVAGVGDAAWIHYLNRTYVEVLAFTGPHHIGIQLGVETGKTVESTRPEAIALANDILAKLR